MVILLSKSLNLVLFFFFFFFFDFYSLGLDEQHRDNSGWTPLHYATFEGHIEVCEALLEAGAKVDEPDNDGKGPLMLAAQEGHGLLVETLLRVHNAPPDQRAHDGKTALR